PIWSRYIQHFHTCCRYRPRSATSHGPGQHRDLPSFPTRRSSDLQIDVFWAKQGGQDPVELMKKYPQRITMLHLKDRQHGTPDTRSEEHTSELQSREKLVCRLLLEKKNKA